MAAAPQHVQRSATPKNRTHDGKEPLRIPTDACPRRLRIRDAIGLLLPRPVEGSESAEAPPPAPSSADGEERQGRDAYAAAERRIARNHGEHSEELGGRASAASAASDACADPDVLVGGAVEGGGRGPYVRLMGVVVEVRGDRDGDGDGSDSCRGPTFVIDDGTASVEVRRAFEEPPPLPSSASSSAPRAMKRPRTELGGGSGTNRPAAPAAAARGRGGGVIGPGSLVDCVGYLSVPPESGGGGGDGSSVAGTTAAAAVEPPSSRPPRPPRLPLLTALSVGRVRNPDAEALRTLEILLSSSSSSSGGRSGTRGSEGAAATTAAAARSVGNGDGSGVRAAGDLVSKIGAFAAPASGTAKTFRVRPEYAFRLIKSASSDGGLTEEDLAIVLGCGGGIGGGGAGRVGAPPGERERAGAAEAVRDVLQELQAGGEIYMTRRGTYLPL